VTVYDSPGAGRSAAYQRANGDYATVYIYDGGQRRAPEGPAGPDVAAELKNAGAQLVLIGGISGRNQSIQPAEPEFLVERSTSGKLGLRCQNFRTMRVGGSTVGDAVCLTVLNGQFLKVRATSANGDPRRAAAIGGELVLAMQDAPRVAE
jgi:hypothetical protein